MFCFEFPLPTPSQQHAGNEDKWPRSPNLEKGGKKGEAGKKKVEHSRQQHSSMLDIICGAVP